MRRLFSLELALLLGMILFGGFAYLTRFPETAWLADAQDWPVVGGWATRFRTAYLGPETAGQDDSTQVAQEATKAAASVQGSSPRSARPKKPAAEPPVSEPISLADPPGVDPAPSDRVAAPSTVAGLPPRSHHRPVTPPTVAIKAKAWMWFLPGQELLSSTGDESRTLDRLDTMAYLPVFDRDGVWAEVLHQDQRGWIDTSWEPPYARRGARRGILRQRAEKVRGNDPERLRRAWEILDTREEYALGPYKLYTDVQDADLLAFLDGAASRAETAYFARYGRLPSGDPERAAVLFADRAAYQSYTTDSSETLTRSAGHAGGGVLVLFAGNNPRIELARTLVHEITHLLNNRALARNLPLWLEEGMAGDLGSVWVENSREVARSDLLGDSRNLIVQGAAMRLLLIQELLRTDRLPALELLWQYNYEIFHKKGFEPYAYAHSVAFVRYLVSGDEGRHAEAFRAFLKKIADGRGADPRLLMKLLGVTREELEKDFRAWIERQELRVENGTVRLVSH